MLQDHAVYPPAASRDATKAGIPKVVAASDDYLGFQLIEKPRYRGLK